MKLLHTSTIATKFPKIFIVLLFFILILAAFYAGRQYQKNILKSQLIFVTMANNSQVVQAKLGDLIKTDFGSNHSWNIQSSNESIVKLTSSHDAKAVGRGTAQISALIAPVCKHGMICPMFIISFKTKVVVQ